MKLQRFSTDTGMEVPGVTISQMREVDRIDMVETGPNLFQMMENASRNLAVMALERSRDAGKLVSAFATTAPVSI